MMNRHAWYLFVAASVVALLPTRHLIAQGPAKGALTTAEIQQLIIRGEPGDHTKLSTHFAALADQYAADAKRHAAMRPAFAGNTKLAHMAASQAAHCQQLARRNEESAATLRALADHHRKEAAGVPSTPPPGSERFQSGEGARVPSDAELARLAGTAETAADHRALESYFATIATRYDREARDSEQYARSWRSLTKNPSAPALAVRWDGLAKQQRASAEEARAAAAMHKEHARTAK